MVDRLVQLSDLFNSIIVVDAKGVVLADSSHTEGLVGQRLIHPFAKLAMAAQGPLTSQPYRLPYSGCWLVSLSQPIFGADGQATGYIAGNIYLHAPSIVRGILGEHSHEDGSFSYVLGSSGMLIYYPVSTREGESVHNPAEQAVRRGEHGSMRFLNQEGVDMLGGYAPVASVGWGVIVQKPTKAALARVDRALALTLLYALPACWRSRASSGCLTSSPGRCGSWPPSPAGWKSAMSATICVLSVAGARRPPSCAAVCCWGARPSGCAWGGCGRKAPALP